MTPGNRLSVLALVAVVLLAGCGAGGGLDGTDGGDGGAASDGATATASGTLAFYVSDQPTAIGDFERLTVTVTEIGVHRADGGGDDEGTETGESTETTTDGTETTTTATETTTTATTTDDAGTTSTATATTTEGTETTTADTTSDGGETADGSDEDAGSDAGWTTHPVDNETVDLTELQGENATKIADVELPAGEYNGVYLAISNVTGVLTTGETVDVKLPSSRLRLNKGFTLGPGGNTSFVFDIAVHRAGGSGKYVLRPVIGQSGPDVPIQEVRRERTADDAETDEPGNGGPPSDRPDQAGGPPATTTEAGG